MVQNRIAGVKYVYLLSSAVQAKLSFTGKCLRGCSRKKCALNAVANAKVRPEDFNTVINARTTGTLRRKDMGETGYSCTKTQNKTYLTSPSKQSSNIMQATICHPVQKFDH